MGKFSNTTVKVLTTKDFDSSLTTVKNSNKPGLIVFYQEWCGYCQMVAPALIELSKNKSFSVYAVEGDYADNMKLFEKMQIQGVPNIHYISAKGKIAKPTYMGPRDILSFAKFINSKTKATNKPKSVPVKKVVKKVKSVPVKKSTKKPVKKVKSVPVKKSTKKPVKKVKSVPIKKSHKGGCLKCKNKKCTGGMCKKRT